MLLYCASLPSSHDFHMSRTIVNYDTEEQAIQVTMSLFIDDVELAIAGEDAASLKFCTRSEVVDAASLIDTYINTHLKIKIDGSPTEPLFYIGKEQSEDLIGMYCYLEIEGVTAFDEITISNNVLIDQFDDQRNLITFQVDKRRVKDFLMTGEQTEGTYSMR